MIVTHASVSGHTNDTHAGLFDIPLMGNIPYLTYLAPTNKQEYLAMLDWSLEQTIGPVAIRTPWTAVVDYQGSVDSDYSRVSYKIEQEGSSVAIIALGSFFQLGEQLASEYEKRTGIRPTLINPRFINGVDAETLENLKARHEAVVTLEDSMVNGGFGARIAQFYGTSRMIVKNYGFTMDLPINYNAKEFMRLNGLTPDLMADDIISLLQA
jgi:Deoxyxylulose-5-phosphate synthase